ncbi:MAG: UDP-glucose 4-epimerase GalE [Xanthomonadaceae bacterium]|nr:UDP-glucose 4-epimerase GalE [Xanthomonadaceae bacterium]
MAKIIVTGGAGYVGSHAVKRLAHDGHEILVIDNLVHGHAEAVKWGDLEKIDLLNLEALTDALNQFEPESVLHFAAYAYVGESVREPVKYYENNVLGTLNLLKAMKSAKCSKLVFSSTCATYGEPKIIPITESTPQHPINPYGQTKLMVEQILRDAHTAYGLESVSLRYFNAAGADPEGEIGENHHPETHLIPLTLQTALGKRAEIEVLGTDYPTADGSCIRDYIHVMDLAEAHVLALKYLEKKPGVHAFNLGTETGTSVLEIIKAAEKVSGKKLKVKHSPRRAGDPPVLVADASLAKRELGWKLQHSSIDHIIRDAWKWIQKL